jgi:hypothetical protein
MGGNCAAAGQCCARQMTKGAIAVVVAKVAAAPF